MNQNAIRKGASFLRVKNEIKVTKWIGKNNRTFWNAGLADEVDKLEELLLEKEAQLARIQDQQNRSATDMDEWRAKDAEYREKIRQNNDRIHALETELESKTNLVCISGMWSVIRY